MAAARSPWPLVATLAAAVALAWPPDRGPSALVRAINWIADPAGQLPRRPEPLAMGVDDDADVVTAHDTEEAAYEAMHDRSALLRARFWLRDVTDPMEPSAERPLLVAIGAVGALVAFTVRARRP
jgi:hypothetical protein